MYYFTEKYMKLMYKKYLILIKKFLIIKFSIVWLLSKLLLILLIFANIYNYS